MQAQLVTMEGESFDNLETMAGIGDWFMSTVKGTVKIGTASVRGAGHFIGEAGRGIRTGDIGRVVASPFRGVGHTFGENIRGYKTIGEWYYRPSKMRQWMSPIGAGLTAAGTVPSPASPFLLAGGGLLTIGGAAGEAIYQKRRQVSTDPIVEERIAREKQTNMLWTVAGVGLLGVSAAMILT